MYDQDALIRIILVPLVGAAGQQPLPLRCPGWNSVAGGRAWGLICWLLDQNPGTSAILRP